MGPVQTPKQNGRTPKNTPGKPVKGGLKTSQSGKIITQKDKNSPSNSTPKMAEMLASQKTPGSLKKSIQNSPKTTPKGTPKGIPTKQRNPPKFQEKPMTPLKRPVEDEDDSEEESEEEEKKNGVGATTPTPKKVKIDPTESDDDDDEEEVEEEEDDDKDDDDEDKDDDEEEDEEGEKSEDKEEEKESSAEEGEADEDEDEDEDEGEEVSASKTVTSKKAQGKQRKADSNDDEEDDEESDDANDDDDEEEEEGEEKAKEEQRKLPMPPHLSYTAAEKLEEKGTPNVIAHNCPQGMLSRVSFTDDILGYIAYFTKKTKLFVKSEKAKQAVLFNHKKELLGRNDCYLTTDPVHEVYAFGTPVSINPGPVYESLEGKLADEGVYGVYVPTWRGKTVGYAVFETLDEASREALLDKKTIEISGTEYQLHTEKEYKEKYVLRYANMPTYERSMIEQFKDRLASMNCEAVAITRNYMYFDDQDNLKEVLKLNGEVFEGRKVVLMRTTEKLHIMLVKNISPFVTEEEVAEFLKDKGISVQFVTIWGFQHTAYVAVTSEEDQKKLLGLHQTEMEDHRLTVIYFNEKEADLEMCRCKSGDAIYHASYRGRNAGRGRRSFQRGGGFRGGFGLGGGGFRRGRGDFNPRRGFGGRGRNFRGGTRGGGDRQDD